MERPPCEIALMHDHILRLEEEINQLKAESKEINEKLKEKFSEFMLKSSFTIAFQDDLLNKYKQTLKEIKEIAEILAPMTDEYENCLDKDRCFECDFTEDCSYFNIKQILQKISEVIDD